MDISRGSKTYRSPPLHGLFGACNRAWSGDLLALDDLGAGSLVRDDAAYRLGAGRDDGMLSGRRSNEIRAGGNLDA